MGLQRNGELGKLESWYGYCPNQGLVEDGQNTSDHLCVPGQRYYFNILRRVLNEATGHQWLERSDLLDNFEKERQCY